MEEPYSDESQVAYNVPWGGLADTIRTLCHESDQLEPREQMLLARLDGLANVRHHSEIAALLTPPNGFTLEEVEFLNSPFLDQLYLCVGQRYTDTLGVSCTQHCAWIEACKQGLFDVVQFFMKTLYGVCQDEVNAGFVKAVEFGKGSVVRLLLEYGADVSTDNDYALIMASTRDESDVSLLLLYDPNVHAQSDKALQNAAARGNASIVSLLLSHRRVDVGTVHGQVAFVAAKNGHLNVLKLLFSNANDAYYFEHHHDYEDLLTVAAKHGQARVLAVLLDVTAIAFDGVIDTVHFDPLLRDAIDVGSADCLRVLLPRGGDEAVRAADDEGLLLCRAAETGLTECVELLLDAGVDVQVRSNTPLIEAVSHGHVAVVELLLLRGADPFAQSNIPLFRAAEFGCEQVLELLIKYAGRSYVLDDLQQAHRVAVIQGSRAAADYLSRFIHVEDNSRETVSSHLKRKQPCMDRPC